MISEASAVQMARNAILGKANLQEGSPVKVDLRRGRYVVTFVHINPPGVRGPDYDARVTLDAGTGEVLEILGAP